MRGIILYGLVSAGIFRETIRTIAFCDDKKGAVAAGRSGRRTWHWMHVDDSVVAVIRDITNLHPIELDLQCEVLYLQKT